MKILQGTVSLKLLQKIADTLRFMRQGDKKQLLAMVDQILTGVGNLLKGQRDLKGFNGCQPE